MRVPLGWLAEFVSDLPEVDQLSERLTMAGLEVEEIDQADPRLVDGLITAKILEKVQHPNADRLSLCSVDFGEGPTPIVCGAKNMDAGDVVVLARPGTVLPGGMKIKKSKIRGEVSQGMLCSAAEIGLSDDHDGIIVLPGDTEVGAPAAALLGLDQIVFELGITPNRGDCLSIRGVAREVGALCGNELTEQFHNAPTAPEGACAFKVEIDDDAPCSLYRGLVVDGVKVGPSPSWLASRLTALGLRPINNVVDVTNYVLMELGQPLHAFDADLLKGDTISVRKVASDMAVETLDEEERKLLAGDMVICDAEGPVAVAGVMGGARTAVHEGSTRLFLECAYFEPSAVRVTSRRLGLVSDSSYRFERGVDDRAVERALLRTAELIIETAGGSIDGGVTVAGSPRPLPEPVRVRTKRVEGVLGRPVAAQDIERHLQSLGAQVSKVDDGVEAVSPSHRHDLAREIDYIEEVARIEGYDSFADEPPALSMSVTDELPSYAFARDARARLAAAGLFETVSLSFCSEEANASFAGLHAAGMQPIAVRNPLRADETQMRRSLLPGLLSVARHNVRSGLAVTDLFSIGRTFVADGSGAPHELSAIAGVISGPRRDRGPGDAGGATFWDVKGVVERLLAGAFPGAELTWVPESERSELHPREGARIEVNGTPVGVVGKLHPDLAESLEVREDTCVFEVDSDSVLQYSPAHFELAAVPKFPASSRDVSFLAPIDLLSGEVVRAAHAQSEPCLERVSVFDEYVGEGIPEGHKALAFQFVYRAVDRTLTDEEVAGLHERIVESVVSALDVTPRA